MQKETEHAVTVLKKGGTILYPTDTIWGIGCDATSEEAVSKVYRLKDREETKSLIVLVSDREMLAQYVAAVPDIAHDLIASASKPITIVYPGAKNLAGNAVAGDGTIAIRIAKDDFCNKMIRQFGKPIVSTSANVSGAPPPVSFRDIQPAILNGVDYVVNLRKTEVSSLKPSTIIRIGTDGDFEVIRD